jgi:hypothetical protein
MGGGGVDKRGIRGRDKKKRGEEVRTRRNGGEG